MSQPVPMLLTLAVAPSALGAPPANGVEFAGRGYRRVPTGPLINVPSWDPSSWQNTLPIVWPQAPEDWGHAVHTLLLRASDSVVLALSPAPPGFFVREFDQPRIPPFGLVIGGVGPATDRPYGTGRFSESLYSVYPPGGAIFYGAALLNFQWARQPDHCAAWAPSPPIVAGGCA